MAIKPKCDMCKTELNDYGAILLSPPKKDSTVVKYHLCKECYKSILSKNKISINNNYKK